MSVGGIIFHDLPALVFDTVEQRQVEGVDDAIGYVGWEILSHTIVRIDYPDRILTFYKLGHFQPNPSEERLSLLFFDRLPEIDAVIDGEHGHFVLDTGSRASLLLLPKFAKRVGLVPCEKTTRSIVGWSLTGPERAPHTTISEISLGRQTWKHLDAALISASDAPPVDGNIGGAMLRKTVLTLDFEQNSAWLKGDDRFSNEDRTDRSGLWINRTGKQYRIVEVVPGSESEKAGLQAGDEISAVDGEAAQRMGLSAIRERLSGRPGNVIQLTVERSHLARAVVITLRQYPASCINKS